MEQTQFFQQFRLQVAEVGADKILASKMVVMAGLVVESETALLQILLALARLIRGSLVEFILVVGMVTLALGVAVLAVLDQTLQQTTAVLVAVESLLQLLVHP
jgi:hypothetical protein